MPSARSSRATRSTIISKPSSPNLRCSSLSKFSAMASNTSADTTERSLGNSAVSSRRAVHGDEPAHRIDERLPVGARLGDLRREFEDRVGEPPPGLMLLKEYVARLDELPGLAKMRENLLLLVALVIVVDEIAHDLRSLADDGGIEAFVIGEVAHRGFR